MLEGISKPHREGDRHLLLRKTSQPPSGLKCVSEFRNGRRYGRSIKAVTAWPRKQHKTRPTPVSACRAASVVNTAEERISLALATARGSAITARRPGNRAAVDATHGFHRSGKGLRCLTRRRRLIENWAGTSCRTKAGSSRITETADVRRSPYCCLVHVGRDGVFAIGFPVGR